MVSDLLMLRFYKDTGDHKSYITSLIILMWAMSAHVVNSLSQNKHSSLKIRALRVLQTLFLLNPVVHTYGKWSGKVTEEGATMNSNGLLMFTKLIEMIFEALPQLILQVGALMRADSIALLPAVSICLSVATAGFLIADLSVGMERGMMTDNFRGPHTAKWCGILPLNFEWVFFLGHMMLVSGFFAAHVLALTVGGLVLPGYAIPAYMVSELQAVSVLGVEVWEGEVVSFFEQVGLLRRREAGVARHELCADADLWQRKFSWRKDVRRLDCIQAGAHDNIRGPVLHLGGWVRRVDQAFVR